MYIFILYSSYHLLLLCFHLLFYLFFLVWKVNRKFSRIMRCCFCFEPRVVFVHGKRKLRSLFWRVRADFKRQIMKNKNNQKFNYDPFSYSLNFDDGNFGFFCWTSFITLHHLHHSMLCWNEMKNQLATWSLFLFLFL